MLQQILATMYIDPDILEALNEEQKKTLFLKMREEQVRRWKEREEKEEREGRMEMPRPKKATFKKVSWLLGRDGDVYVRVIGETDEFKSSKLLSDLRGTNENNLNTNRPQTTGHLKSSLDKPVIQQDISKPGIELLLNKTEEMNHSSTVPDIQKENNTQRSTEELKIQKDESSNLKTANSYRTDRETSAVARPNQFSLQKRTTGQDAQEKEVINELGIGSHFGSRVAQLRMNFNTPSTKVPSPYTKPPIPTKPAHLLTAASVR